MDSDYTPKNGRFIHSQFFKITVILALVLAIAGIYRITHRPGGMTARVTCAGNMSQIGLALRLWSDRHNGYFPWQVSTNQGGTMELCARNSQGFDTNTAVHLRVLSGELSSPLIMLCPKDRHKKAAADWSSLGPQNVTYQLRTVGTNVSSIQPEEVLLRCPIDGNILRLDWAVTAPGQQP